MEPRLSRPTARGKRLECTEAAAPVGGTRAASPSRRWLRGHLDAWPESSYLGPVQGGATRMPALLRHRPTTSPRERGTTYDRHLPSSAGAAIRRHRPPGAGRVHGHPSPDARSHDEPHLGLRHPGPYVRSGSFAKAVSPPRVFRRHDIPVARSTGITRNDEEGEGSLHRNAPTSRRSRIAE